MLNIQIRKWKTLQNFQFSSGLLHHISAGSQTHQIGWEMIGMIFAELTQSVTSQAMSDFLPYLGKSSAAKNQQEKNEEQKL